MSDEPNPQAVRWSGELKWLLVAGEEVLGTLTATEVDAPWVYCQFEPTDLFASLRPLFEAEAALLDTLDDDASMATWEAAYAPIEALHLLLIPDRGGAPLETFLLHLQGEQAWFRA
jgi:hypothetical protein